MTPNSWPLRATAIERQRRANAKAMDPAADLTGKRERVLFIGTQFSNLYTAVDTPAKGRVGQTVGSEGVCMGGERREWCEE
jgi:hypothetical protein